MDNKYYDLAVYIGRFQPWHVGHSHVLSIAKGISTQQCIVLGSMDKVNTKANPWTCFERISMMPDIEHIIGIRDYEDDRYWQSSLEHLTDKFEAKRVVLIGHEKDQSSNYLRSFIKWDLHLVQPIVAINATDIREAYFRRGVILDTYLEQPAIDFLTRFAKSPNYKKIRDESYS